MTTKSFQMLIGGEWTDSSETLGVYNPQDNSLFATVPRATKEDVLLAIETVEAGAEIAASMPVHERVSILNKTADYVETNNEQFARTIASEVSKTITEARSEVARCVNTIRLSAEEASRINGETIPFDQMPGHEQRVGYFYRFPIGIIAAITPFNDPLNLVAHKIRPAIATGNAIIVKPATLTPIRALLLAEAFDKNGLPEKVLSVITGSGREIGDELITHPALPLISFTGGLETGTPISKRAGLKKISMELGSNSPTIVLEDADLDHTIASTVAGAFGAVGQNCLGVQRVFIQESIFDRFIERFVQETNKIKTGNKLDEATDMGPLINETEAIRIETWVDEAVNSGAKIITGGLREGAFYTPTVLDDVPYDAKIAQEEIFGPVVLMFPIAHLDEAITKANRVNYGLQAGIFTKNIEAAFAAIHRLDVGGIMVNDSSDYRIDAMPFGGVKGSGLGREGVKFSMLEMTDPKVVNFNL